LREIITGFDSLEFAARCSRPLLEPFHFAALAEAVLRETQIRFKDIEVRFQTHFVL
jgi:hypothetical protein